MLFCGKTNLWNGCFTFVAIAAISAFSGILAEDKALTMLSRLEQPFLFDGEEGDGPEGFVPEYVAKLGEVIKRKINLEALSPTGSVGDQTTQMLNRLEKGSVDIIGPLAMTHVNERSADFTKPLLESGIVPVAKISTMTEGADDSYNFSWIPLPAEVFLILKPFSAGIWLFTIFCFVGVSVFLYLIYRFNPRERRTSIEVLVDEEELGILSSFLFVFSTLVWQGYTRAPRSISGRILAAFWWIFTVIFLACYTAKLVFYLNPTMGSPKQPSLEDSSLDDIAARDDIVFGVVRGSPEYYFFRESRVEEYEKIWTKMNNAPNASFVASTSEGFQRARDSNFVFLVNGLSAEYAIGRQPCDLIKVGPRLTSTSIGLAVKTGSTIRDQLNLGILELRENGVTAELQRKWWQSECDPTGIVTAAARAGLRPMKVTEFGGAFILLIIGAVLAGIALLLEILFVRRQKRKEQEPEVKKTEDTALADTPAETAKV